MAKKKPINKAAKPKPHRLTVSAAADVMGCSPQTVRRLCHDQKLSAWKIGRIMVVGSQSVEAYLDAHRIGPRS